jgi:LPS-assembly protein
MKNINGVKKTKNKITVSIPFIFFILFMFFYLSLPSSVFARENIKIYAEHLEYRADTKTYIARGSVEITYGNAILNADEIQLNNTTSDAVASGHVRYEDPQVIIHADKIEINLDTGLGIMYRSKIFHKKRNYHIKGNRIKKVGRNAYFMDSASATTCDNSPPSWFFTGKDINIKVKDYASAKNTIFYIKNVPVLYSPYFRAPLERRSGFLIPSFGLSNTRGFIFKQGLFWAIRKDMDATFYLDYFHKKGIGKGIDYRYVINADSKGEFWLYHLRDNDLSKDFSEVKSYHTQKLPHEITGTLRLHFVNEFDFYEILDSPSDERIGFSSNPVNPFGFSSPERLQKYLESDLHLSRKIDYGRLYFLSIYRQNLEGTSGDIAQILPEIGFIINTSELGKTFFNMEMTGTHFWRKTGQYGNRVDIYPNFYLSYGRLLNFTQKIGLRETLYFLDNPSHNETREIFDTRSILTTRFFKRYPHFIHMFEPSLELNLIPAVDHTDIPEFDSADSIPQTSDLIYAFTNRLSGETLGNSEVRLRLSQRYSLLNVSRPFSPIQIESTINSSNIDLSANALFDVYEGNIPETISRITFRTKQWYIGAGKNLRRSTNLDQYSFEAGLYRPVTIFGKALPLDISSSLLYDLKGGGIQEMNLRSVYTHQCWGITVSFTRKPYEYQIMLGIEFRGFGAIRIG